MPATVSIRSLALLAIVAAAAFWIGRLTHRGPQHEPDTSFPDNFNETWATAIAEGERKNWERDRPRIIKEIASFRGRGDGITKPFSVSNDKWEFQWKVSKSSEGLRLRAVDEQGVRHMFDMSASPVGGWSIDGGWQGRCRAVMDAGTYTIEIHTEKDWELTVFDSL